MILLAFNVFSYQFQAQNTLDSEVKAVNFY